MISLDIFFLILLGVGFVFGLMKGAFRLLATLAGIVLGIYLSRVFYHPVGDMFISIFHLSEMVALPLAFFLLFVLIMVVLFLLGRMMTQFSKAVSLSWLNRLCGALLGALQVALLLGVLINLYSSAHHKVTGKETVDTPGSLLYKPLKAFPDRVLPYLDFDKWSHPQPASK